MTQRISYHKNLHIRHGLIALLTTLAALIVQEGHAETILILTDGEEPNQE